MKRILPILLISALLISGCASDNVSKNDGIAFASKFESENKITLSDEKIEFNGKAVGESGDVFLSHDIIYYEEKDKYDSGNKYGEGEEKDMHSEDEANSHSVLNITKSGAYRISGTLSSGQIRVDLGEDAKENPDAVVELILDNANITCTVAPAILFVNVYECDYDWSLENASFDVDTSDAGATLVLADGSENNVHGSYVEKIFKDESDEKKLWKQDGAIYSYMSMNVFGNGTLNLFAENEGLDTELHLTINGGNINIYSDNDGINTNEDGVSVTTINGGNLNIVAGLGSEGDGIDSNGWLIINGGNVISSANPMADAGLDSDMGSYINGGTVVALGSTMDWPESDSDQVTINLQFAQSQKAENEIVVKDNKGNVVFQYKPTKEELTEGKMRDFRGAVISSPEFKVGEEYTVYIDGVKQGYTGTDLRGFHGGRPNFSDGKMPEGERPTPPDGEFPKGERPTPPDEEFPKGEGPARPDGEFPKGERPARPDGEWQKGDMPQKGETPQMRPEQTDNASTEQKDIFLTADKVNRFSGVSGIR